MKVNEYDHLCPLLCGSFDTCKANVSATEIANKLH